jgi:NTP pyrophosphatase (non-canonical NTP hydrolase)
MSPVPSPAAEVSERDGHVLGGPTVVICGSFRRDPAALKRDHEALRRAGATVLSPLDVEFVAEVDGFVLAAHELDEDPAAIEARHLSALKRADMVWLHAPQGYVGPSAALELGVAHTIGLPIFARHAPIDGTLRPFATAVVSPEEAIARLAAIGAHTPGNPLEVLQDYYGRMARERGYQDESPQDTMLLLTEEVGELARAVRRTVGLARSGRMTAVDPAEELADVQLYLLHLANVLGIRLGDAVVAKERTNRNRNRIRIEAEAQAA